MDRIVKKEFIKSSNMDLQWLADLSRCIVSWLYECLLYQLFFNSSYSL